MAAPQLGINSRKVLSTAESEGLKNDMCRVEHEGDTPTEISQITFPDAGDGYLGPNNMGSESILAPSPVPPVNPVRECVIAIRWLQHTGFPQYAHLYEAGGFPIEIDSDKLCQDHVWLQTYPDGLVSLMDRLKVLNLCAEADIKYSPPVIDDDSDDDLPSPLVRASPARLSFHAPATNSAITSPTVSSPTENLVTEQQYVEDDGAEERDISAESLCRSEIIPRRRLERGARVTARPKCAYIRSHTRRSFSSEVSAEAICDSEHSSCSRKSSGLQTILASDSDSLDNSTDTPADSGPCACPLEEEEPEEPESACISITARRGRWHSFSSKGYSESPHSSCHGDISNSSIAFPSNRVSTLSVVRIQSIRHMSLLKLTTQFECYVQPRLSKSKRQKVIQNLDYTRRKTHDYDKSASVFGIPLDVLTRRNGLPMPKHIIAAMEYILVDGATAQGLFRVAGSSKRIRELKKRMSCPDEIIDFCGMPIPDIACVIKEFFRDIPGQLFTSRIGETLVLIAAFLPEELHLQALQHTMLLLPDENRETAYWLLDFLKQVSTHSEITKMDCHNLAVVFAPNLFPMSTSSDSVPGHSSPPSSWKSKHKKRHDFDESTKAIAVLELMIQNSNTLQRVPIDTLAISIHSSDLPLDFTEIVDISELGKDSDGEGDYVTYVDFCMQSMLKEHNSGYKNGWIHVSTPLTCEISRKKVRDGHHLQLWRAVVDITASPQAIQQRVLQERDIWDTQLVSLQCVETLDDNTEVVNYVTRSTPGQPHRESTVLRSWLSREGIVIIMATSVRHPKVTRSSGVVITELATRYVIESINSNVSRLTLIVRHDLCGRSVDFYKSYGPWSVSQVTRIRDSFISPFKVDKKTSGSSVVV